eukprot:719107-Pleurochrysis_carterae.AAC.2
MGAYGSQAGHRSCSYEPPCPYVKSLTWRELQVRWLVDSAVFRRDVATARAMSDGKAAAYAGPGSGRIDDDVQLAYWMSQLPGLQAWAAFRCARKHLVGLGSGAMLCRIPLRFSWLFLATASHV